MTNSQPDDDSNDRKSHRERHSGRKAEKKKEKKSANRLEDLTDKQRNPKAFAFNSAIRAERRFRRKQDINTKKQHVPLVDRTPLEPPPILVAVVGPPKVGKSTVINNLIKLWTKSPLVDIKGPVTIVTGKKRRMTFIECNNDINSMIDLAKIADLVLLLCDASFGFEMEVFEFLNICQVHGMPKIMGILTHLDMIKNAKTLKNTKKILKHRFWTEVYQGAKLFYLSGIIHNEYLRNEITNLGRFISVMKFRPLTWRTTHGYLLADRYEDLTNQEIIRKNLKCDRNISLYGYIRGVPIKKDGYLHIAGLGDVKIHDISFLPDPCPLPDQLKKRALIEKEKLIYAPFSGVGGIVYDKDAVYVDLGGSHSHNKRTNEDDADNIVTNLIDSKKTLDAKMAHSKIQIFSGGKELTGEEFEGSDEESEDETQQQLYEKTSRKKGDEEELEGELKELREKFGRFKEQKIEDSGRTRRRVVFETEDEEFAKTLGDEGDEDCDDGNEKGVTNEEEEETEDEDEEDNGKENEAEVEEKEDDEEQNSETDDDDEDYKETESSSDEDSSGKETIVLAPTKIKNKETEGKEAESSSDEDLFAEETIVLTPTKQNSKKKNIKLAKEKESLLIEEKKQKNQESTKENVVKDIDESEEESDDNNDDSDEDGRDLIEKNQMNEDNLKHVIKDKDDENEDSEEDEENADDESNKASDEDFNDSDDDMEDAVKWKENLADKARNAFLERQNTTQNLMKLVYGIFDVKNQPEESTTETAVEEEDEEIGGLFKKASKTQQKLKLDKDTMDLTESSILPWNTSIKNWLDALNKIQISNCFVTGKWKESEDASELLKLDDAEDLSDAEMFGDFEDLETGEKHEAPKRKRTETEKDEEADREALAEKKRKLKEKFDEEYDHTEKNTYYDDLKQSAEKQAQLNKTVFENMSDDVRVQIEGFRPGMYVRVEIQNVAAEFITNFDPTYPLLIGALNMGEENVGFVNVKIKKHRWYNRILKTNDPLIISLGWRRFQTIPLYSKLEDDMKFRYLKYTPEHLACNAHFWGPITPQGSGFLALQSVESNPEILKKQGFRIAATGVVQELDKSTQVMKKLKIVGYPLKIYKKTVFVKQMFTSALEVAKFEGARIKTVSGIRGMIKKAVSKPEGCFRATFEDKIQLSDIIFLRTWTKVDVPRFYNPVTTLLLPQDEKNSWRGLRTTGAIKRENGIKNMPNNNSLYKDIVRNPTPFKPLMIPAKLQKMLPYKDKPKHSRKGNKRVDKDSVAVIMEPYEEKVSRLLKMTKANFQHKQNKIQVEAKEKLQKYHAAIKEKEDVRNKRIQQKKKNKFRKKGKAQ